MSAAPSGRFTTRSEIEDLTTSDFADAAARWRTAADQSDEVFDRHRQNIASPGGTTWEGDAKDAALDRAIADGVVAGDQNGVVREAAGIAEDAVTDISAAQREVVAAITTAENDGFTVSEDLKVTDARKYDINTIAERNKAAAEHAEDIRWYAERLGQTVAFAEGRLQAKAGELEGIRFEGEGEGRDGEGEGRDGEPTVQLVDNKVQDKPSDDGKGEKPGAAPGQIGPFAVPKSVEDAAKKDGLKPEEKPAASDVGGDLGDLLGVNDPPAAGAEPKPSAPPISPQAVEQFKSQARNLLRQQGVPPDQIESQVNAMVADAQRMNAALADSAAHTPAKPDTTPGPAPVDTRSFGEKLGDGFNNFVKEAHDQFYNRLDSTVETLQNLTGTGGEGRPGVLESWQQLGEAAVENHMKDPLHLRDPMGPLGPWGAVNGVVDDIPEMIENPGKHAGDVLFDATAMAATAPLGAEGLLGKSMLPELGALERGVLPEVGALERGVVPVVPHTAEPPVVPHTAEPPVAPRTAEAPPIPHSAEPVAPHTAEPPPVPHTADPPAGHHTPSADAPVEHSAPAPDTPAHHVPDQVPTHRPPAPDTFDPGQGLHYPSADSHHPGMWPPQTPDITYNKAEGQSGWTHIQHNVDKDWLPYQGQIGGVERTPEGAMPEWSQINPETGAKVDFDGHDYRGPQEVFLEAKDGFRGLAFAPDNSYWEGRAEKALAQVQRQLEAIPPDAVLEWHVSDPYGAAALRQLFQDRQIYDVDVFYTPKAP
ncbi:MULTISPECIES: Tox-REase-5 domain-containing protein [Mycobacteriaceae]|uniref:Tox-REase-5 domain-containing protein n=1 Tax=Mycobacteriaceae TaxID=1762 RepID=UPI000A90575C|nr:MULTISPECIES: Tox-REase-5 domain-containing protein [Mycolicibacterium]